MGSIPLGRFNLDFYVIWYAIRGDWDYLGYNRIKQSSSIKWNQNLSRKQTLVTSKRPPTEIKTDHGNKTSIYTLNIYLLLCWLVNRFSV
jgi:hypothetical protein